jgi:hypothetical protein
MEAPSDGRLVKTASSEQNAVHLFKDFFLQGYNRIEFETKVGGSVYFLDWKIRARKY